MTIRSKPYYWVVCDHDGCLDRSPVCGWEVEAWADAEQAEQGAEDDDWTITEAGEHFCLEHRPGDAREDDAIENADIERKERDRDP